MSKPILLLAASAVLAAATLPAIAGSARPVCGWYAIASCVTSEADAGAFASKGWGAVINTDDYLGLRPGLYCVVSGPQPKCSAERDRRMALHNGVAPDVYIKRACTDATHVGD